MANKFAGMQPFEGYEDMIIERTNGVVLATLNVPEKLNAREGQLVTFSGGARG